jgi:DNA-binding MarR family transcriptional regulator
MHGGTPVTQKTPDTDLALLISAPRTTRILYPRGRFEDLEASAVQVLIAVQLLDAPTVRDLESALAMSHGTVTTALGVLDRRGFVHSRSDPADGRARRQIITADGEKLVARFAACAMNRWQDTIGEPDSFTWSGT